MVNQSWVHRHTPLLAGTALVALAAGGLWQQLVGLLDSTPPPAPGLQRISIIRPAVAPPPRELLPKPQHKPPQAVPAQLPSRPSAAEAHRSNQPPKLGLKGPARGNGDPFGLSAVDNETTHIGADASQVYAGLVQRNLSDALNADRQLRRHTYAVVVHIWIAADGLITRSEIVKGSGSPAIDQQLQRALNAGLHIGSAPPTELPQPIKLAITSRS